MNSDIIIVESQAQGALWPDCRPQPTDYGQRGRLRRVLLRNAPCSVRISAGMGMGVTASALPGTLYGTTIIGFSRSKGSD